MQHTNNKLEANRMHLEQFQKIMQTMDADEARSCAYILVRRYPDIVMDQAKNYITVMNKKLDGLNSIMGEDYNE